MRDHQWFAFYEFIWTKLQKRLTPENLNMYVRAITSSDHKQTRATVEISKNR